MAFRGLMHKLCDALSEENVLMMNYLCKDCINLNLNQPFDALQLLAKFEDKGLITKSDMSFLAEVLYRIERIDLLKLLPGVKNKKDYEVNYLGSSADKYNFSAFRVACFRLINQITCADFKCLKNLCKDKICNRNFHKSSCIVSLLVYLEEEDVLSEGNLDFFADCLSRLDNRAPYDMFCHLMRGEESHIFLSREQLSFASSPHSLSHSQSVTLPPTKHPKGNRLYSSESNFSNHNMLTSPKTIHQSHDDGSDAQALKFFLGPPSSSVDNRTFSESDNTVQKPANFSNGYIQSNHQFQPSSVTEHKPLPRPNQATAEARPSFSNPRFPSNGNWFQNSARTEQPQIPSINQQTNDLQDQMQLLNLESQISPTNIRVPMVRENFQGRASNGTSTMPRQPSEFCTTSSDPHCNSFANNQFVSPLSGSYNQPMVPSEMSHPRPDFNFAKSNQFHEFKAVSTVQFPYPYPIQQALRESTVKNLRQDHEVLRHPASSRGQRNNWPASSAIPSWPNSDVTRTQHKFSSGARHSSSVPSSSNLIQPMLADFGVGVVGVQGSSGLQNMHQRHISPQHPVNQNIPQSINLANDVVDGHQSNASTKMSPESVRNKSLNAFHRKEITVPSSSVVYTSTGPDSTPVSVMSSNRETNMSVSVTTSTGSAKPICSQSEDMLGSYPMNSLVTGICLIINNCNFESSRNCNNTGYHLTDRKGSEFDVEAISEVFKLLRFDVRVKRDLDAQAMTDILESMAKQESHTKYSCFILVIMSHGGIDRSSILYGVDGKKVKTAEIKKLFQPKSCPTLRGKPKIFFYQACQTPCQLQRIVKPATNSDDLDQDGPNDKLKVESKCPDDVDFLICYAAVPGGSAYRSKSKGSFFITHVAKNLKKYYKNQDLLSIMVQVNNDVVDENLQQVSMPVSTLRGKIFFTSNYLQGM